MGRGAGSLLLLVSSASACLVDAPGYLGPATDTVSEGTSLGSGEGSGQPTAGPAGQCASDPASGTALATAAASMSEGQWQELITLGLTDELLSSGGDWVGMGSNSGVWDPVARRALFVGLEVIQYDEASNEWTVAGPDPYDCECLEGADHTTIDPSSSTVYHRGFRSPDVFRLQQPGTWEPIPAIPNESGECCNALEFFGARDELMFADASGVYGFDGTGWMQHLGSLGFSDRNLAEYHPTLEALLLGSGQQVVMLDAMLQPQVRAPAPVELSSRDAVVTPDLVTGEFLVLADPGVMYRYAPGADRWTEVAGTPPPFQTARTMSATDFFAVSISSYCLTMFVAYDLDASAVHLLRHG